MVVAAQNLLRHPHVLALYGVVGEVCQFVLLGNRVGWEVACGVDVCQEDPVMLQLLFPFHAYSVMPDHLLLLLLLPVFVVDHSLVEPVDPLLNSNAAARGSRLD